MSSQILVLTNSLQKPNYVKSVRIRSFSGPYFPAFGLNTDRYRVSLHLQSKCRKIRTRKTSNTDPFYAVPHIVISCQES